MRTFRTVVTMSVLLVGCATPGEEMSVSETEELNEPLYCEGEGQCNSVWERATYYVSTKSGYKIQNINDSLIETYNSNDTSLAWKIVKKPLGEGRYQILTSAWCGNPFGCYPDALEATLDAKRYMKDGL